MKDDPELREAAEDWRQSKESGSAKHKEFVELLRAKLATLTPTEIAEITNINRPTLYYLLWGRNGRGQRTPG